MTTMTEMVHDHLDGDMVAHAESSAGARKNDPHHAGGLDLLEPGEGRVEDVAPDNTCECEHDQDRKDHGCDGDVQIRKDGQTLVLFLVHEYIPPKK